MPDGEEEKGPRGGEVLRVEKAQALEQVTLGPMISVDVERGNKV